MRGERRKRALGLPPAEAGGWISARGPGQRRSLAHSLQRARKLVHARARSPPADCVIKPALAQIRGLPGMLELDRQLPIACPLSLV